MQKEGKIIVKGVEAEEENDPFWQRWKGGGKTPAAGTKTVQGCMTRATDWGGLVRN